MYKHILYLIDKTHIHITMVEEDIPAHNNGSYYFYKLYGTDGLEITIPVTSVVRIMTRKKKANRITKRELLRFAGYLSEKKEDNETSRL